MSMSGRYVTLSGSSAVGLILYGVRSMAEHIACDESWWSSHSMLLKIARLSPCDVTCIAFAEPALDARLSRPGSRAVSVAALMA